MPSHSASSDDGPFGLPKQLGLDESGYSPHKVYGMKLRFSLATMAVMIVAASLLLALLKAVNAPLLETGFLLVFLFLTAVGQMFLFGGKSPRWASAVVGFVVWPAFLLLKFSLSSWRIYFGGGGVRGLLRRRSPECFLATASVAPSPACCCSWTWWNRGYRKQIQHPVPTTSYNRSAAKCPKILN